MAGTVAEAQSFKRACAMFGLGRYLYELPSVWTEFDSQRKRITDAGQKELDNRYRSWYAKTVAQKATPAPQEAVPYKDKGEAQRENVDDVPFEKRRQAENVDGLLDEFNALGQDLYGEQWDQVCRRNVKRISGGKTQFVDDLSPDQIQKLVTGMWTLQEKRKAETQAA
jgi:hypothetical protein